MKNYIWIMGEFRSCLDDSFNRLRLSNVARKCQVGFRRIETFAVRIRLFTKCIVSVLGKIN